MWCDQRWKWSIRWSTARSNNEYRTCFVLFSHINICHFISCHSGTLKFSFFLFIYCFPLEFSFSGLIYSSFWKPLFIFFDHKFFFYFFHVGFVWRICFFSLYRNFYFLYGTFVSRFAKCIHVFSKFFLLVDICFFFFHFHSTCLKM